MLAKLPFELIAQIVSYLPNACDLSHLSSTCQRLHKFTEDEGWRVFVQERFPSLETPPYWRDASHALTTLSRNWDRRAVIARYVEPGGSILKWPGKTNERRWSRPRGQTMGFQPAIDSYEEFTGDGWSSRREVLAYNAGAELVLRVKTTGNGALRRSIRQIEAGSFDATFDHHRNTVQWTTYKPSTASQGTDDITCLKLQHPRNIERTSDSGSESLLLGTAAGSLRTLTVPVVANATDSVASYEYVTDGRSVKSLDTFEGPSPLLAACLSGTAVAVYALSFPDGQSARTQVVQPDAEIPAIPSAGVGPKQQAWTVRFLSHDRLAVGIGPSGAPLRVYQVSQSGIAEEPLRRFECHMSQRVDERTDVDSRPPVTSAYQILPLTSHNTTDQRPGDVFLTGFHDGLITVSDMRSPRDYVQAYRDPIDPSAIYSLAAVGRERFVAGGARHSVVKFFDLRMSNGRAYYHRQQITPSRNKSHNNRSPATAWNLFLTPKNEAQIARQPWRARQPERTRGRITSQYTRDSPIYSLSSPSTCSPSLFAGIENNIVQIDMASMMDPHSDPLFSQGIVRRPGIGDIHVKKTWDPIGDVIDFAMYEHSTEGGVGLMNQANAGGTLKRELWVKGYDERWRQSESWKK